MNKPRSAVWLSLGLMMAALETAAGGEPARAASGALDASFGGTGVVTTDVGSGADRAEAMLIQPDGRIVVAGGAGESAFVLTRYNDDGSLDSAFGTGGVVTTAVGGHIQLAFGVALQTDGRIVAVGNSGDDFAVVRYNTDGSLDTSFGSGGRVVTVFGGWGGARAVVIQPDGKIVVLGAAHGPNFDIAVARYHSDGSLDTSFGGGGMVTTDFGAIDTSGADALALQPDGRIIVGGNSGTVAANVDAVLARYNTDGSLDTSFGSGGTVRTDLGGSDSVNDLALQPDGKIVAGGGTDSATGTADFALIRYTIAGQVDTTFGVAGVVTTDFGDQESIGKIASDSDGSIVAGGCTGCGGPSSANDFALARYTSEGVPDAGFGTGGQFTTNIAGGNDLVNALAFQADGKLLVAGVATVAGDQDFVVARYQSVTTAPVYPVGTNSKSSNPNNTITARVGTQPVTAGDTIAVAVATGTFAGPVGCTDNRGNTYTAVADKNTGNGRLFLCSALAATALTTGDTITATYPGFSGTSVISVNAISHTITNGTVDQTAVNAGNNENPTSGNVTASQGHTLVFGAIAHNSTPTCAPASSFTLIGPASGGSGSGTRTLTPEYAIVTAAGAYAATGTLSAGQQWRAAAVSYHP